MICELTNKMDEILTLSFGRTYHPKNEVTLTEFLFLLFWFVFVMVFFVWWMYPIQKLFEYFDNITFKCNKKK